MVLNGKSLVSITWVLRGCNRKRICERTLGTGFKFSRCVSLISKLYDRLHNFNYSTEREKQSERRIRDCRSSGQCSRKFPREFDVDCLLVDKYNLKVASLIDQQSLFVSIAGRLNGENYFLNNSFEFPGSLRLNNFQELLSWNSKKPVKWKYLRRNSRNPVEN